MLKQRLLTVAAAGIAAAGVLASPAYAQMTSRFIERPMAISPDALTADIAVAQAEFGTVEAVATYEERRRNRTEFTVSIARVASGPYQVIVDGVFRGFISVLPDRNGESFGELTFSTRPRGNQLLLNFEPRNALIEVRSLVDTVLVDVPVLDDEGNPVLDQFGVPQFQLQQVPRLYAATRLPMAVSVEENDGIPNFNRTRERVRMTSANGMIADGMIKINSNPKRARMSVRVRRLDPGLYDLRQDGVTISQIVSVGPGRGIIRFDSDPRRPGDERLDFEPTGGMYQLVRTDLVNAVGEEQEAVVLQSFVPANPEVEGGLQPLGDIAVSDFATSGFDRDGNAEATFEARRANRFEVLLHDVPAGSYSVRISDVEPLDGGVAGMFGPFSITLPDFIEVENEGAVDAMPGQGDDDQPEMLPQGVGPDNNGVPSFGQLIQDQDRNTRDIPPLVVDPRGKRITIEDSEGRVYFDTIFPGTSPSIFDQLTTGG
jgi:hypothetical protein